MRLLNCSRILKYYLTIKEGDTVPVYEIYGFAEDKNGKIVMDKL